MGSVDCEILHSRLVDWSLTGPCGRRVGDDGKLAPMRQRADDDDYDETRLKSSCDYPLEHEVIYFWVGYEPKSKYPLL
jgi:hypothetical protein